jgi:hypothetical protein
MHSVPAPDSEGFYEAVALRAFALDTTSKQFCHTFMAPALVVTSAQAGAAVSDGSSGVERSYRRTMTSRREEDETGRVPVPFLGGVARYKGKVAFLAKRAGNPFPNMFSIGRAMNNDVVVLLETVSKLHGYFRNEGDNWCFIDHRSTNGTHLNGKAIEAAQKQAIKDGDMLRLGLELELAVLFPTTLYGRFRGGLA